VVVRYLDVRNIESFFPCHETVRLWESGQRLRLLLPLFPTYLFVHIKYHERGKVLQSPGILQIVGNNHESIPPRQGRCANR
jgi:hypothetical protein